MSCESACSIFDRAYVPCPRNAAWCVKWWCTGINNRYVGSYKRNLCDGCMEPWLSKIRPAHDIHYARI